MSRACFDIVMQHHLIFLDKFKPVLKKERALTKDEEIWKPRRRSTDGQCPADVVV
ncbi:hypothetical protein QJS04_geneDACA016776 [Acorus gramineus]|uniref:Uncharacterized protein n=1 Tax=Acorus gramineus TaxID=55184 RepID=A0AAV9BJ03_ACOGR|nr:hypothetical protein QJS04_geneDACA016776 [Acorus gramineus]